MTLLAVSKRHSSEAVRQAHAAGLTAFGENYVQEGLDKIAALADLRGALAWHLIGPLQSNKTRAVAEAFDWVHSVDRLKTAQRLSEQRPDALPPLNVCLQVNISGEDSKSGVAPEDVLALARAVAALPRLRLRGLMSIPEPETRSRSPASAPPGAAAPSVRPAQRRGPVARHAVDGHERRPGGGGARRCDDGARRHGDLRRAPLSLLKPHPS